MKIRGGRLAGSACGLAALMVLGLGSGLVDWARPLGGLATAQAQEKAPTQEKAPGRAGREREERPLPPWTALHPAPERAIAAGGMWAEVIASTSRWIVVQNPETGQQFPIAGDRIRQFLVRWPSSLGDLKPTSMVEATGFYANGAVTVDHVDVYEADAQNLVTPTMQTLSGTSPTPMTFDSFTQGSFGIINYQEVGAAMMNPSILHVVGRATSSNPLMLAGFGTTALVVAPGSSGMSVSQVTLGTNSYAKKGDVVYLSPDGALPRSLDVSQLVLYKKIPLRQFQP